MVSIPPTTTPTTTNAQFPQLPEPQFQRTVPQALAVGGIRSKTVDRFDARISPMRPVMNVVNVSDPEGCDVASCDQRSNRQKFGVESCSDKTSWSITPTTTPTTTQNMTPTTTTTTTTTTTDSEMSYQALSAGPGACGQHATGVISPPCGKALDGVSLNPHAVPARTCTEQNLDGNSARACGNLVLNERLDPLRAATRNGGAGISRTCPRPCAKCM